MQFICYLKCSTCIKAKNYLDSKNIKYDLRDIKNNNPTEDELQKWFNKYNFNLFKAFNTSGLLYKELGLKDKINSMNNDELIKLLSTNGMLIKRPILISDKFISFGFNEKKYDELIYEK